MHRGPAQLTLVRHGESVGNLADRRAREEGAHHLELETRDADVELSDNGRDQADALSRWLRDGGSPDGPTVAISSPYRRAEETARRTLAGLDVELVLDERLRERDLGLFDAMTGKGIRSRHPEEAQRREKLGKFYYQPPSGESWADVVLRVRSLLADLRHGFDGARVWMFTHQAVIMSFRYALEGLTEERLLEIDRTQRLGNASTTRYRRGDQGYELLDFAGTEALDASDTEVTHEEPEARDEQG